MPSLLAEMSTRIDFLSSKLTESGELKYPEISGYFENIFCKCISATNAFGNGALAEDTELSEWVSEILDHGFHGIEQILFSLRSRLIIISTSKES